MSIDSLLSHSLWQPSFETTLQSITKDRNVKKLTLEFLRDQLIDQKFGLSQDIDLATHLQLNGILILIDEEGFQVKGINNDPFSYCVLPPSNSRAKIAKFIADVIFHFIRGWGYKAELMKNLNVTGSCMNCISVLF